MLNIFYERLYYDSERILVKQYILKDAYQAAYLILKKYFSIVNVIQKTLWCKTLFFKIIPYFVFFFLTLMCVKQSSFIEMVN